LRVKKIFWVMGGLCAAAAGFLAWGAQRSAPVDALAQRADEPQLEDSQADDLHPDEAL
jgi:hypothetical protein